jgi:pimeloyl-ACP methyl ester carboxylesterase
VSYYDVLAFYMIDCFPGDSGVEFLRHNGRMIQNLVDGEKSFDVISFDTRGIAFSTPGSHCFSDYLYDEIWELKKRAVGHLDTGPEALKMQFVGEKGRSALCAEARSYNGSEDNVRAYMSTAYVARDMLEIVRKNKVVEDGDSTQRGDGTAKANEMQKPLRGDPKAQLQYIGLSYGTFLGNTFASLYPEHVGKMLLDGNIDADDWGRKWMKTGLLDFEEAWSVFFERCYSVGKICALWRPSDTSPADIRSRIDSILKQINESPVSVSFHGSTELVTYSEVKLRIVPANYQPGAFIYLASFLNAIGTGNVTKTLPWIKTTSFISCTNPNSSGRPLEAVFSYDAAKATICGDADSLAHTPLREFEDYLAFLESQSPTAGPLFAEWKLACMAEPSSLRPKWRFTGPFGTTEQNNTATPILFLNNRLDPVCPIRNARKMAEKYSGSVVLEQDALGHCALSASLGECVTGHVKRYFNDGLLPDADTVCPGGCQAFDEGCGVHDRIALWQTVSDGDL